MPSAGPRKHYQTAAWKGRLRTEVFERDGWRCRQPSCRALGRQKGGTAVLTLAHIHARGPAVASNLLTICLKCHGKMDGGRRYRRKP